MILLLAVQRAAPLPVTHGVGAVADGLPRHRADFALVESVVDLRPVHEAGLRLHHPEVLSLEPAGQVMGSAIADRVEMALADVVVPGREVEILATA